MDDRVEVASDEEFDDTDPSRRSFPNVTIGICLLLNFVLSTLSSHNEEVMRIFIYTWIMLAIIFIRRNKENPFNWFVNIFIFLQVILVFAAGDSVEAVVGLGLLALLFVTIVVLIIKGNGVKNDERSV